MFFYLTKIYAYIYFTVQKLLGVNIRGLGFALRLVRSDRVIMVNGLKMYFNHKVAASYARPVIGDWNEPETHILLNYVLPRLPGAVEFVDVGANVGEMVLDVSRHSNVTRIVAFEPISECVRSIIESFNINGYDKYQVVEKLVGQECGWINFSSNSGNTGGSSVYSETSFTSADKVQMTRLDDESLGASEHLVMLVDVEGYEPSVLRGGGRLIQDRRPLIIFEYNDISKKHFRVSEIQQILGAGYTIYRLMSDGLLDGNVESAWNCVAVPSGSVFESITNPIVLNS